MTEVFNTVLAGLIFPFVGGLVTRAGFSKGTNGMIILALSMVFAIMRMAIDGGLSASAFSGEEFFITLSAIIAVSQGLYPMVKGAVHGIEAKKEEVLSPKNVVKSIATDKASDYADAKVDELEQLIDAKLNRLLGKLTRNTATEELEVEDDYERIAG